MGVMLAEWCSGLNRQACLLASLRTYVPGLLGGMQLEFECLHFPRDSRNHRVEQLGQQLAVQQLRSVLHAQTRRRS